MDMRHQRQSPTSLTVCKAVSRAPTDLRWVRVIDQ